VPKLGAGYRFNLGDRRATVPCLVGGAGALQYSDSQYLGFGTGHFTAGLAIGKDDRTSLGLQFEKETQGNAEIWTISLKQRF
jgi:hypothetical protein